MTQPTTTRPRLRLKGFASERVQLIREMEDDGWTGRITARGHALMLAPNNGPTSTISAKGGCPNGRGNASAVYKAWKREQTG